MTNHLWDGRGNGRPRNGSALGPRARAPLASVEPWDLSGTKNQNPPGVGLFALWTEDLRTHGYDLGSAGFWVVAIHRFGNWRMTIRPRPLRLPFSAAYKGLYRLASVMTGIELPYATKLGRRVRFWHHGGTVISARAIGDDVHFRHNTTVGVAHTHAAVDAKPIIGNRVDVGVGAAILGPIAVGDDVRVGANAVLIRDADPGTTVVGIPAQAVGSSGRVRRI